MASTQGSWSGVVALVALSGLSASCVTSGEQPERLGSRAAAITAGPAEARGGGEGDEDHHGKGGRCRAEGARCEDADDCCRGLSCRAGTCRRADRCAGVICVASCTGTSVCDASTGACAAPHPRTPAPITFRQLPPAAGSSSTYLAVGDVDGDGRPDVVTAEWFSHTLTVFLNDGTGALRAQPPLVLAGYTGGIALGDLDGDGVLDLAAVHGSSVAVLHGHGDGTFTLVTDVAATGAGLDYVLLADLDRDGKLDVAASDTAGNAIFLWRGDGAGGLTAKGSVPTAVGPRTFFADTGPGGQPALVVPALSSRVVQVFAGNGAFAFAAPVATSTGWIPFVSAYADVDGDGHRDLIFGNEGSPTGVVDVVRGLGGSFCAPVDHPGGDTPDGVGAGDLDHDGLGDVVISDGRDGSVQVYLSRGDGTLMLPVVVGNVAPDLPGAVAIADMNGDGKPDLVVSQIDGAGTTGLLTVLLQN